MNLSLSFRLIPSAIFALIIFSFWSSSALADCGSIITPEDIFDPASPMEATPIDDCDNPFGVTSDGYPYTLIIDGEIVTEGGEIIISPDGTIDYSVDSSNGFGPSHSLYFHDGEDYRFVEGIPFMLPGDDTPLNLATLLPGTYTLVSEDSPLILNYNTFWQKLLAKIVPTAQAQYIPPSSVYTITFTLVAEASEPTGASSVLFLPGIMGSRLYEESDECDGGVLQEQERWVSTKDCDQLRLATDIDGDSINDIYTKRDEVSIVDEVGVSILPKVNIYKSFLKDLKDWKEDEIINDYTVVPYDWRLKLDDILRSKSILGSNGRIEHDEDTPVHLSHIYETLFTLAQNSDTDKVTIIAHSNGGLVAKQLLHHLEATNDPLLDKIDNLILVAVPQVGSVEDVIGILHGSDVGPSGIVMKQNITRQLMNTMPFARHLLPTETYFNTVNTPVINFIAGESTQAWYDTYNHIIATKDELHNFLRKESGREKPQTDDLATPEVIDGSLLAYADEVSEIQTNWTPKGDLKVYQIAGTGLLTPANITYFTDQACIEWNSDGHCLETEPKLGYFIQASGNGDATVSVQSALEMNEEEAKKLWVNLEKYNDEKFPDRKHSSIFEVEDIRHFIANTIESTTTRPYTYLTNTEPNIPDIDRLVFQLHSPLDMSLTTDEGEISSSTNTINGATYRRYGELQYLAVPRNEGNITLHLKGIATGSFTLDVEEVDGDALIERHTYSAIPSATGTVVTMELEDANNIEEAILNLDYDGDGEVDITYDTAGEVVEEITYDHLTSAINAFNLKRWHKFILLNTAKTAEKLHQKSLTDSEYKQKEKKTLKALKSIIRWYQYYNLISEEESEELQSMIDSLINNI